METPEMVRKEPVKVVHRRDEDPAGNTGARVWAVGESAEEEETRQVRESGCDRQPLDGSQRVVDLIQELRRHDTLRLRGEELLSLRTEEHLKASFSGRLTKIAVHQLCCCHLETLATSLGLHNGNRNIMYI